MSGFSQAPVAPTNMGNTNFAVGQIAFSAVVDFSVAGDNAIPITLPAGFTKYIIAAFRVAGASADISAATLGLYSAAAAGGVNIITTASVTINTASDATNSNAQALTVLNTATESYSAPILYARVGSTAAAGRTAKVTVVVVPVA